MVVGAQLRTWPSVCSSIVCAFPHDTCATSRESAIGLSAAIGRGPQMSSFSWSDSCPCLLAPQAHTACCRDGVARSSCSRAHRLSAYQSLVAKEERKRGRSWGVRSPRRSNRGRTRPVSARGRAAAATWRTAGPRALRPAPAGGPAGSGCSAPRCRRRRWAARRPRGPAHAAARAARSQTPPRAAPARTQPPSLQRSGKA